MRAADAFDAEFGGRIRTHYSTGLEIEGVVKLADNSRRAACHLLIGILDVTDATDEMSGVQGPVYPWSGVPRTGSFAYWRAANRKPILYRD